MAEAKRGPIGIMRQKFQSKSKLVEELLSRASKKEGESKDDLKKRLLKSSNKKLLKLREKLDKP